MLALDGRDWWPVMALAVVGAWEVPRRVAEGADPWWCAALTLAVVAPLGWRRAAPMAAFLVTALAFAAYPLGGDTPELLTHAVAMLLALFAAAAYSKRAPALVALAVGASAGVVRSWSLDYDAVDSIVNASWALPAWLVGRLFRQRDERAVAAEAAAKETADRAEHTERLAIEAERRRIARELHDVVAHAVTVMLVQARGGRHSLDHDPQAARAAFATIEEQGAQALAELRRLLGVLPAGALADRAPDPLPGLAAADRLVEQMRAAGLDVHLTREGAGATLSPSADFSAYRVLQEALTNALRYAGDGTTDVRLRSNPDGVVVEVRNPVGNRSSIGSGSGLAGARERVAAFGGGLRTERTGDEFLLQATFPSRGAHAPTGARG